MTIETKTVSASVKSLDGEDDSPNGSFDVILSAQTKDRDGDTLLADGWKTPLPDHITFDIDHGMSVATTVGSGKPFINDDGNLQVRGTFASTPLGQTVRTLVKEGHIRTSSVAFMSEKSSTKDGGTVVKREVLNGAFTPVPSNREAVILSVKSVLKAGARNSAADAEKVQGIHDTAAALGADCGQKSFTRKDADTEDAADPGATAQAVDAAIDEAIDLFAQVDLTSLPAEVQQAIALVQAADAAVDELLDALGVPDPDEDAAASGAAVAPAPGAEKSAPVAGVKDAPVADADSDAVTVKELEEQALKIQAAQFI